MSAPDRPLTPADLSPAYLIAVGTAAYEVAHLIARTYEPVYAPGVDPEDLEPITLSAADAIALAAYVGAMAVLTAGEL